jgi:hypothetical protein
MVHEAKQLRGLEAAELAAIYKPMGGHSAHKWVSGWPSDISSVFATDTMAIGSGLRMRTTTLTNSRRSGLVACDLNDLVFERVASPSQRDVKHGAFEGGSSSYRACMFAIGWRKALRAARRRVLQGAARTLGSLARRKQIATISFVEESGHFAADHVSR